MDRGNWWATVHRVTKSQTQRKQPSTHACTYISRCAQSCLMLCDPETAALQTPPSMDSPGKHAGAGWHFLLPAIFEAQGSNICLLHVSSTAGRFLPLNHHGSSFICISLWFSTIICQTAVILHLNHLSTNSSGEVHGTECLHSARRIVNASHLFMP